MFFVIIIIYIKGEDEFFTNQRKKFFFFLVRRKNNNNNVFLLMTLPICTKKLKTSQQARMIPDTLQIIDTDDLVNPANERRDLHINSRNVSATTTEAPGDQAG